MILNKWNDRISDQPILPKFPGFQCTHVQKILSRYDAGIFKYFQIRGTQRKQYFTLLRDGRKDKLGGNQTEATQTLAIPTVQNLPLPWFLHKWHCLQAGYNAKLGKPIDLETCFSSQIQCFLFAFLVCESVLKMCQHICGTSAVASSTL